MKEKTLELRTKRLTLHPMSAEELADCIENTTDSETRQAYIEMQGAAEANPGERIWYVPWKICLRKTDIFVGDVGFKGPVKDNSVEIGYGLLEKYRKNGYMTEAAGAIIEWAFMQEGIVFVESETTPDNEDSKKVLERLNFKPDGLGEEGPRFVLEAPKTAYLSIYMSLGMCFGVALGSVFDSFAIGMCIGLCIGMAVGAALDSKKRKEREEIVNLRKQRKEQQ